LKAEALEFTAIITGAIRMTPPRKPSCGRHGYGFTQEHPKSNQKMIGLIAELRASPREITLWARSASRLWAASTAPFLCYAREDDPERFKARVGKLVKHKPGETLE
jgi:hypothetical protein